MRLLFVVNPIAGGRDKQSFLDQASLMCEKYGIGMETYFTTGQNDTDSLRAKIDSVKPDRVVSTGGDGTTQLTAKALLQTNIPFGIVPMGSANGMAKELGVPNDPMLAFQDIISSEIITPIDILRINTEYYSLHLGDVGINASLVEKFAREERRGWLAYAKHLVEAVKNAPSFKATIEINGRKHSHKAFAVIIANTRMYGTGAIINPRGNPFDGFFEIVITKQNDLQGIINLGLTAFTELAFEALEGYFEVYQGKEAVIHLPEPKMLQLDGELVGKTDTIHVEIIHKAVNYISTNDQERSNHINPLA
jgi:diacylglycerol kinase (ATP)